MHLEFQLKSERHKDFNRNYYYYFPAKIIRHVQYCVFTATSETRC